MMRGKLPKGPGRSTKGGHTRGRKHGDTIESAPSRLRNKAADTGASRSKSSDIMHAGIGGRITAKLRDKLRKGALGDTKKHPREVC